MNDIDPILADYLQRTGMSFNEFVFELGPNFGRQDYTFFNTQAGYQPNWQNSSIHTTEDNKVNSSYVGGNQSGTQLSKSKIRVTYNSTDKLGNSGIAWGYSSQLHIDSDCGISYRSTNNQYGNLSYSGGPLKVIYVEDKDKTTDTKTDDKSGNSSQLKVNGNTISMGDYTATINDKGEITYKDKDEKTVTANEVQKNKCKELVIKANEISKEKKKA
ncbi:MAG: hypothetical protein NC200_05625 [Candidatus Gastranaerophilales bacterium]|nr:hypothetical protein [Candidatus Gastranaerophilales bacterium]